jgi:hypothetical protein
MKSPPSTGPTVEGRLEVLGLDTLIIRLGGRLGGTLFALVGRALDDDSEVVGRYVMTGPAGEAFHGGDERTARGGTSEQK